MYCVDLLVIRAEWKGRNLGFKFFFLLAIIIIYTNSFHVYKGKKKNVNESNRFCNKLLIVRPFLGITYATHYKHIYVT